MRRSIWIMLLAAFLSCKPSAEKSTIPEQALHGELEIKLDSLFDSYINDDGPGAAILVAYDGQMIVGKGYGLRDLESKAPITRTTNMRMGSVSKQFTALTVLKLQDQGKIELTDTVYKYYPFDIFKNVTVDQLIRHASGIADAEEAFFEIWDSTKIAENKDVVDYYQKNPEPLFSAGERLQYNNGAYELLAALVGEISGQDFADFAKEAVFEKAGMENTVFFDLSHPVEIRERAYCYEKDSLDHWEKVDGHFLNGLLGAGGVYTSVQDYFAYDQALRNKRILQDKTHDMIFSHGPIRSDLHAPDFPRLSSKECSYAMGWEVSDSIAVHGGGWFGTNTFVIHELKRPLTIAIFMNSNSLFGHSLIEDLYAITDEWAKGQVKFKRSGQ